MRIVITSQWGNLSEHPDALRECKWSDVEWNAFVVVGIFGKHVLCKSLNLPNMGIVVVCKHVCCALKQLQLAGLCQKPS